MIHELETVILSRDIEEYSLKSGDIGTAVHVYNNNVAYEVEFIAGSGKTIAVLTLTPEDVRPIRQQEVMHVRELVLA